MTPRGTYRLIVHLGYVLCGVSPKDGAVMSVVPPRGELREEHKSVPSADHLLARMKCRHRALPPVAAVADRVSKRRTRSSPTGKVVQCTLHVQDSGVDTALAAAVQYAGFNLFFDPSLAFGECALIHLDENSLTCLSSGILVFDSS